MQPSLWFSTGTKLHTIFPVMLPLAYNQQIVSIFVHHNSTCTTPYAMILELPAPSNSITITKQLNQIE
jgi:hypothetical protein